jgi:hypothetical protein
MKSADRIRGLVPSPEHKSEATSNAQCAAQAGLALVRRIANVRALSQKQLQASSSTAKEG